MILEGLVTTLNADGSVNIAPMGPRVDERMERFLLRPFPTSTTYQNLLRTGEGVLHITDDVELLARSAVGRLEALPELRPAIGVQGWILVDACRWYAFQVRSIDDRAPRVSIEVEVVAQGTQREFFGFNRAKHAVLEAAILATRIELLPADEILAELGRLASPVEKTGGPRELSAFQFLQNYVGERLNQAKQKPSTPPEVVASLDSPQGGP